MAQEVKKLAEETTKSGQSISQLLGDIRSLIEEAVSAMDSMQAETNRGMELIGESRTALDRIVGDIRRVSGQIQEVSATSEEMSAEMEEVSAAIANIADVSRKMSNETQTIAQAAEEQLASMEQLRQSADELEKMSRQLKEDLSRFVLREI